MATQHVQTQMPAVLPHGWKKAVAATLNLSRNTITNALNAGESHPQYARILKCAKEKYGKVTIM